jgi:anti-sigma-K factor RskA
VDASRFISSGLIEAYVSGLASSDEVHELERGMVQYPEVKAAVNDCQLDMEHYITLQAQTPPPQIRTQLISIIADEEAAREKGLLNDEPVTTEYPEEKVYVSSIWRWIAAASILLLAGSLIANYIFFSQIGDYKNKYEVLLSSHNSLATESNLYRTRLEEAESAMSIVRNPAIKTIRMPGTKPFPAALATVYWNQQSKEVFVMVNNLPEPAADKQYQLWAIVDGKPVDMGVFETGNKTTLLQKMKSIDNAEVFAVTLENKGGSPAPTLDQMYVAGKAS